MARIRNANKNKAGALPNGSDVWLVGAYIRLSREDQVREKAEFHTPEDEEQAHSASIINQKKIITEYLDANFHEPYELVDFYLDDGLTGTDDTRKDFARLVGDIEKKLVNCMVVKTLSRAFRNYADQGYYLESYFPQQNVRFICIGDPIIDTFKNPEAITGLEVPITGIMNDRYAAKTSNDVRRTFDMKRRNGEFIGAFPPYGYFKDPADKNKLVLDREICQLKHDMRNWIVHESMSLSGVAKRLNERGILNPGAYKRSLGWNFNNPQTQKSDGMWTGTQVKAILLDKVNLGHMVQGKQRVVSYKVHDKVRIPESDWIIKHNTHEATFTQEEYDELESFTKRDTRTPNGERQVYLFGGFLRCADCNKALQRRAAKHHVYYACRTYTEKSKDRCTKHTIRLDRLESAVLACVQMHISLIEGLAQEVERINKKPNINTQSARLEKLIEAKRLELARFKDASDSLYLDMHGGLINKEDFRRMKAKFDKQIEQTTRIIAGLEEEMQISKQGVTTENALFVSFLKFRNVEKLDRALLLAIVDTIYVHENSAIDIHFQYVDHMERIMEYIEANKEEEPTAEECAS